MQTKWFIIGGVLLFIYLAKKKKDREKEEIKFEVAVKSNEMSTGEQVDLIRLKIEDWLANNMPFASEDEIRAWVLQMTSELEEYKQYLEESE